MKAFTSTERVERIIDSIIRRNGGLTLKVEPETNTVDLYAPEIGYQVGVRNIETIDYTDCIGKLESWLKSKKWITSQIGLWLNDGKLYVDESIHVYNIEGALKAVRKTNEKAIWDWERMIEIEVQ